MPQTPFYLYDKQLQFVRSESRIRGYVGGRGCGKTRIGAYDILKRAKNGEPYMAVSPSYVVLEDTTWPTFREVAEQLGVWIKGVKSPIPRATFKTSDGGKAECVFRSGERPDTLRGPSKAGVWLDEASVMHPDVFKLALPTLRYRGEMGSLSLTFTPKGRRHWTFDVFYQEEPNLISDDLEEYGGVWYRRKEMADLIQAHTRENPFLPDDFYDVVRGYYTEALATQELAGEFVDLEGLMFFRDWFYLVDVRPVDAMRVRYWDKAGTEGGGAYSVGLLMSRTKEGIYTIEDIVRGQWSALERERIMLETAEQDAEDHGNQVLIYFEQEPGSGGKESAQATIRKLARFPVYRDIVSGKAKRMSDGQSLPGEAKIVRAQPFAAQAEAGNVRLIRAGWNHAYFEEVMAFPEYQFADQVDASSGAFNKLSGSATIDIQQATRIGVPRAPNSRWKIPLAERATGRRDRRRTRR